MPAPNASAETWMNMINEMQKAALSTRLGIPMIYGIDAVHGHNNVYNATIFPHNIGLGATRSVYRSLETKYFVVMVIIFGFKLDLMLAYESTDVSKKLIYHC